ncbi:UNVERIFIED_ORG: GntR family transcriptional repressor for pyruvate dehydrogenase complex [Rhodococcus erythropolis]
MINNLQVTRKSVPTQIIEHLQHLILSGAISPGSALPSERELAAQFTVSRNTLRQAITYLEAKNLVYTRHGAGVFVVDRPQDAAGGAATAIFGDSYTIHDILEGRLGIEPLVAELAAQRRTDADLAGLLPFLTSSEEADAITLPGNFHSRLARATGNPVLVGLCKTLNTGPEQVGEMLEVDENILQIWDQAHRDIYEAVRDRDTHRARSLMHEHMVHAIAIAEQIVDNT